MADDLRTGVGFRMGALHNVGSQSITLGMMREQSHSSLDIWRATLSLGWRSFCGRKDILFCKLSQELVFVNYCEHLFKAYQMWTLPVKAVQHLRVLLTRGKCLIITHESRFGQESQNLFS